MLKNWDKPEKIFEIYPGLKISSQRSYLIENKSLI